jgi:pilus assembly protein CpaE
LEQIGVNRGGIREAVRSYGRLSAPPLLIVDISHIELPLNELEALSHVCPPDTQVIAVGTEDAVGLYRSLLHYGVLDYFVKPVPAELFTRAVERACRLNEDVRSEPKHGKVVAVMGGSGGVGATTILCAVADLLSRKYRRRVAVLDLNFQWGDVDLQFGCTGGNGLIEMTTDPGRIDKLFLDRVAQKLAPRLSLLSAKDPVNTHASARPDKLLQAVVQLRRHYHFILLDLGRHAAIAAAAADMYNADMGMLILQPTLSGLQNAAAMLEMMQAYRASNQLKLVLNHPRPAMKSGPDKYQIEKFIGRSLDCVISYGGRRVADAAAAGHPITQRRGPVARQFDTLVGSLAGPVYRNPIRRFWRPFIV